eukprot:220139_1
MATVSILQCLLFVCITSKAENISTPTSSFGSTQIFNATAFSTSSGYRFDTIICTDIVCHVICDHNVACRETKIDAFASNSLILECLNPSSCLSLSILNPPAINAEITCGDTTSCSQTHFNLSRALTMYLSCNSDQSCYGSQINCPYQDSSSCIVLCHGQGSCQFTSIEALSAIMDILTIECIGYQSCYNNAMLLGFSSVDTLNLQFGDWTGASMTFGANLESIISFNMDCTGTHSCNALDILIDTVDIQSFYLTCSGLQSCDAMNLDIAVDDSVDIMCINVSSCSNMYSNIRLMDPINTTNINIQCDNMGYYKDSLLFYDNACRNANFHIYPTNYILGLVINTIITATCGDFACYGTVFNFSVIAEVTVNCNEPNSCQLLTIDGTDTDSLDVNCTNISSCYSSNIYCPFHKTGACNIHCHDYHNNCQYMVIHINNDFEHHLDYLDIQCPENSANSVCSSLRFSCDGDGETSKSSTFLIFDETYNKYKCKSSTWSDCCPWIIHSNPILCDKDTDCTVACIDYSCHGVIIDATKATSLTLDCSGDYDKKCLYMIIDIQSIHTTSLHLSCWFGCDYITINALYADIIDINCIEQGCRNMRIWATYSNSLTVNANYANSFRYNTIYAQHSKNIFIRCSKDPSDYDSTCYNNDLYLPDYGKNTYFECYGYGCYDFGTIYVNTSVSLMSVVVNGCGECEYIDDCIGAYEGWNIHCTSNNNTDYFYGDRCGDQQCECDLLSVSSVNNFYDNETNSYCINTPSPTVIQDDGPYESPTNVTYILVSVFSGLCCCIIIVVGTRILIKRISDGPTGKETTTITEITYIGNKEVGRTTTTKSEYKYDDNTSYCYCC